MRVDLILTVCSLWSVSECQSVRVLQPEVDWSSAQHKNKSREDKKYQAESGEESQDARWAAVTGTKVGQFPGHSQTEKRLNYQSINN